MTPTLTLHHPETARRYYAEGVWAEDTLYTLLRGHARAQPERFALRDGGRRLTYLELLEWVEAVAAALHAAGVRPGERVAVWLPARAEAVVVLLACARNGYVCNPSLHQNFTVAEILTLLGRLRAAALFVQPGYGADADRHDIIRAMEEIGSLKRVFRLAPRGDAAGAAEGDDFPAPGDMAGSAGAGDMAGSTEPGDMTGSTEPEPADADTVFYLAFTSGTTGEPKGVMHSANTLLSNARAMVTDWHHDRETVLLTFSPLSHHIATVAISQALVAGMELVVNAPPPGTAPLDWVMESGATYVMGVPTHAIDLLAELGRRGLDRMGRVNLFYMAGSPIPSETARAFLAIGVTPQNVYGMTENSSHNFTRPGDDAETITATCGKPGKGYEIRIWEQENPDREAAPGTIGEIGGRGGMLMLGYFGDQEGTERSFNAHGWFMSGDLGLIDDKGCLRIVGRKKDLIIRGGRNIHPAHIEDLALRHLAVEKAAAFGVPDARLGERICLAVIPVAGAGPAAAELLSHLHGAGLSKYDMPEFFISLPEFPLTASGKVLKRTLVEWAASGRIEPEPVSWRPPAAEAEG